MTSPVLNAIRAYEPELVAIRPDIHRHPEVRYEEVGTAALVAAQLRGYGLVVEEGVGRTGVVATLTGRRPGQRAIALRADMDALDITEATGLPYASVVPGKMHACGHDGHTTMLLGGWAGPRILSMPSCSSPASRPAKSPPGALGRWRAVMSGITALA